MLVQFSVKNFKTFKEKATLSFVASNYDKTTLPKNLIKIAEHDLQLVKSAVVYGGNASGKSNLLKALGLFVSFVRLSWDEVKFDDKFDPFLLDKQSQDKPIEFEIVLLLGNEVFRYGFSFFNGIVVEEWLNIVKKTTEEEIFYRDEKGYDFSARNKFNSDKLPAKNQIKANSLLLTIGYKLGIDEFTALAAKIFMMRFVSGLDANGYGRFTLSMLKEIEFKKNLVNTLINADIQIHGLRVDEKPLSELKEGTIPMALKELFSKEEEVTITNLLALKNIYDEFKVVDVTEFSVGERESKGTEKFIEILGPILDTLAEGSFLAVDELANKLHPHLVEKILDLFNSKETNPNGAQLIFTTHNTNLLNSEIFRRDQIWFTEKDEYGVSKLYSLNEFKGVRNDENFEKNYLKGKYGGIPFLRDFDLKFESASQ